MSIIEQAAKRLEQLRLAGVEVKAEQGAPEGQQISVEPVPLRVVKELESRGASGGQSPDLDAQPPEAAQRSPDGSQALRIRKVEIDLARLSVNGYITPHSPRSRLAEEFRAIKRPLMNNVHGKSVPAIINANRIMVTSAIPGEGKTFVALNLAMSLAMELDTEVLLVDADASRPAVLERLGLEPSKGLFDLLVEPHLPLESAVLATNVERLMILPAGTPQSQSTELLAAEGMSYLVGRLASENPRRVVVFDTPPLLAASESRVLAAHMGQVILVIAAEDTPQGTVAEALSTVENCPVVFTLLNRVASGDRGHHYGSYGAYGTYGKAN